MDIHERIRARAHQLWEADGRPEGREQEHWLAAETEIAREDGVPVEDEVSAGEIMENIGEALGAGPGEAQDLPKFSSDSTSDGSVDQAVTKRARRVPSGASGRQG